MAPLIKDTMPDPHDVDGSTQAVIQMARASMKQAESVTDLAAAVRESTRIQREFCERNESDHNTLVAALDHLRVTTEATQAGLVAALTDLRDSHRSKVGKVMDWVAAHPTVAAGAAIFVAFVLVWAYHVLVNANPDTVAALHDLP